MRGTPDVDGSFIASSVQVTIMILDGIVKSINGDSFVVDVIRNDGFSSTQSVGLTERSAYRKFIENPFASIRVRLIECFCLAFLPAYASVRYPKPFRVYLFRQYLSMIPRIYSYIGAMLALAVIPLIYRPNL